MKKLIYVLVVLVLYGCGGDDGPPPTPEGAQLVFPERDSECTTGIDISDGQSQVTFEWQPAKNTDRYTLTVNNLLTNTPQTIATTGTSAALSIAKGAPFSWSVLSSSIDSDETAISESWLFYNAGSQTTYAPFPAQIVFPKAGGTIQANTNNQVELRWLGADVEGDITNFEVYFSLANPPVTALGTSNAENPTIVADVESGEVYYWRVVTIDSEGNSSDSGVFDFRVF